MSIKTITPTLPLEHQPQSLSPPFVVNVSIVSSVSLSVQLSWHSLLVSWLSAGNDPVSCLVLSCQ